MSHLKLNDIIELLKEFTSQRNDTLQVILIGGLALHYYGMTDRATFDVDAEVKGDVEGLIAFLKQRGIPADMGENISGWSVIGMPGQYRERSITIHEETLLTVKVLHPSDFVISKLRRFTNEDIEDAFFVVNRFDLKENEILERAEDGAKRSPKDTALLLFRKNVALFIKMIKS